MTPRKPPQTAARLHRRPRARGITEALTTGRIDELRAENPDWLQRERATQAEVRTEAERVAGKHAQPRRPRS